jgi:hypothetical protein
VDNHTVSIDSTNHILTKKTISMGGVPLQRVILKEAK